MAYAQTTLDSLTEQIGQILDDPTEVYWTLFEKRLAVYEALYVWGALTSYWRARGTWATTPGAPFYSLANQIPVLRSRNISLNQIVIEIQFMLLENPAGISGAGATEQVSIESILQAVQRARNRFVLDSHLPYSLPQNVPIPPSPDGLALLPDSCMLVHRAAWQDGTSGAWTNLWRQDAWAIDHLSPQWPLDPGSPICYSESEASPLQLQLDPPPSSSGVLEIIAVNSLQLDTSDPNAIFDIPNEWMHAVKYAALADLLGADSQINDPMRAQYADMRYQQAVAATQSARSIIRLMLNGVPLPIDSFASLDAAQPTWRNQSGQPDVAGVQYDYVAFASVPDKAYGIAADVVRSAPLPTAGDDFIQVGYEDLPHILDYCTHILLFKCGGNEFKSAFSDYDGFMKAVAGRGAINAADIRYLKPTFEQAGKDQAERKDMEPVRA